MEAAARSKDLNAVSSEDKCSNGRWTREEHQRFLEAIKNFGKNWKKVEDFVGTRTGAQIRSHAQKFFLRLEKELKGKQPDTHSIGTKHTGSMRKFSETSISTSQTLPDNCSDDEKPENSLKDNLSVHDDAENPLQEQPAIKGLVNVDANASEEVKPLVKGNPLSHTQDLICEKETEEKDISGLHLTDSHLLSKLQNNNPERKSNYNLIMDYLSKFESPNRSFQRHIVDNNNTMTVTPIRPLSNQIHQHHSVYKDLMNYFSKYDKNTKNLKLSDLVTISSENSTGDEGSYEIPTGGKRVRLL